MPTSEDIQFATLERVLRDLWWACFDVKLAGGNPFPLYEAMVEVRKEMERRFPKLWDKVAARLDARCRQLRPGGDPEIGFRIMRPEVVNRHHFNGDDGKPDSNKLPKPWMYIGRKTALGNPYTVQEHGPRALTMYRTFLWDKIKVRDPSVLEAFAQIHWDTHLVCSCKPKPCHGDIVVTCWDWLQRQAWWSPEEHR